MRTDYHSAMRLSDVEAAASRITGLVWRTPMVPSPALSAATRGSVWLKLESVQSTGSFKMRGAASALLRLRERGFNGLVVTASAGNHGLALSTAASRLGFRVRVHLPATAPAAKKAALAGLGAEAVEAPSYDEAEARAHEDAAREGAHYLSAYNDADVIAGAGTVALEMFDERPDLDVLVVPVGGGGLLAGSAVVARARAGAASRSPALRVVGATSYGEGCARPGKPGVYARVGDTTLREWIRQQAPSGVGG